MPTTVRVTSFLQLCTSASLVVLGTGYTTEVLRPMTAPERAISVAEDPQCMAEYDASAARRLLPSG